MSDAAKLSDAARRAVELALAAGAEHAEAYCQDEREAEIRVYDRAVESLTEAGEAGVGIRVFKSEGRCGYAFGTTFGDDGLRTLAARAVEIAEYSDPDEFGGLPGECAAADAGELVSPGFADWTTERKVELAIAVDDAARTADSRVSQVEQSIYADSRGFVALANSEGFCGAYESSGAYAYSSAFAGEGDALMTGLGLGIGRGPDELDADAIGGEAAARAAALVGARRIAGRRAPVLLDAFTAASFMGIVAGALSGEAVLRGRSPFVGREQEEIASPVLAIADDGLIAGGPASAPFDGEGVPQSRASLIGDGRVRNLLYDARTAREAGAASTGNGRRGSYRGRPSPAATNIVIDAGTATLDELIAQAGDGLYVTQVVGLHSGVNPVSGVFSVGASGIEIKDGKLAGPVREATIASDLISMLSAVRAVGAERRWVPFGGSVLAAPLLIGEMTIAGD
ncbi:MAG: TldD/PmbA family protein [Actinobacteria bacterium]|nr:TldD/PmbA family protein [Actinomycetota bacterium]